MAAALLAAPAAWAGGVFRVDCSAANHGASFPDVAALPGGRFAAVWQDAQPSQNADVLARLLADGRDTCAGNGAFQVNTTIDGSQTRPRVAALAGGGFAVAWEHTDAGQYELRAQLFDADGHAHGGEFVVNTATVGGRFYPSVAALAGGGFVVTWYDSSHSADDPDGYAARAQVFNPDGTRNGGEFLINTATTGDQWRPRVAALAGGGFVVTWMDYSHTAGDTDDWAVLAQVFGADGSRSGGEFRVNTTIAGGQFYPSVAALAGGGFVIAWQDGSQSGEDTDARAVRAQVFKAGGSQRGGEFVVNTTTQRSQGSPSVAALAGGGFVIAWEDDSRSGADTDGLAVRAQVFDAGGSKRGGEFLVNLDAVGNQGSPALAGLDNGTFLVAWQDSQVGTPASQIHARIFMAPPTLQLDPASDTGAAGDGITSVTTPTLTGTAKPGSTVTLLDDGTPLGTATADGDGRWSFTPASPLAPGRHALTAIAADTADGESAPAPLVLTIGGGPATPVPTLGQWALMLLAALTAALGLRRPERRSEIPSCRSGFSECPQRER